MDTSNIPVYDQGNTNCSVAYACAFVYGYNFQNSYDDDKLKQIRCALNYNEKTHTEKQNKDQK